MLRFVLLAAVMASALSAPNIIFKNDITPEEAQGYLNSLPFNEPVLSGRTAVLPLIRHDDPRFRSAEAGPTNGFYWKDGRQIENTDDYVEEVYNAAQYHGQDGLGQYAYGYETPESSKVENRKGSGVTSGSYIYRAPNNDIVRVKYWADSQGFHQEDNLPKVELKPAEETPALREARLAFEKAWKEAAEANSKAPVDPYAYQAQASQHALVSAPLNAPLTTQGKAYASAQLEPQYNYESRKKAMLIPSNNRVVIEHKTHNEASLPLQFQQQQDDYQGQASDAQLVSVAAPNADRSGKAYNQAGYSPQYNQQQQYNQQPQYSQPQYNQQQQYNQPQNSQQYGQQKYGQQDEKLEEPEPTGPPHGFFYSFNYPVSIIVPKSEHNPNALPTQ